MSHTAARRKLELSFQFTIYDTGDTILHQGLTNIQQVANLLT